MFQPIYYLIFVNKIITLLIIPPFSTTASAPVNTKSHFYIAKETALSSITYTGIP